jgi:carbamoyl-phosphate synthase small subunit
MEVVEMVSVKAEVGQERSTSVALSATLLLAGGTTFTGRGLGTPGTAVGELIFTTAMTGYEEALTDPSYRGQLLLFTYPLVGNYGTNPGRAESGEVQARAAIVSTLSDTWDGPHSLRAFLEETGTPTLYDVDTRAIAQWVRDHGATPAVLVVHEPDVSPDLRLAEALRIRCDYEYADYVSQTSVAAPEIHGTGRRTIALLDCGNKRSLTEELVARDAQVIVLPADTSPADILALAPDGVMISNGPGNPATCTGPIETVRALYGSVPLFGVCLGHQLLALAAGGRTYKLKFGHRGANHPVADLEGKRAFITTQNHGFAVDEASLPDDLIVSHRNLNDGTVEGLRHRTLPIRSVQFHPEGAPGPRDAGVLLDEWLEGLA